MFESGKPRRKLVLLAPAIVGIGGCSALDVVNFVTPGAGIKRRAAVSYGTSARQKLDLYWPEVVPASPKAVVFFYGGSWNSGSRSDYAFVGKALAVAGITTVVADYRLYPEVRYPEFLKDCAGAAAWSVANLDTLTGRKHAGIYLMGHSAGAYNAAMLALDPRWLASHQLRPDRLAGWIGLAGPYDFLPIGVPEVQRAFDHPNVAPNTQPINYADRRAIRSFIGTGKNDTQVNPKRNSEALAARLRAANTEVVFRSYEQVSHTTILGAFSPALRLLDPVFQDVLAFINSA